MISFMFIVSFLLHIILLIAIYYLYNEAQHLKKYKTEDISTLFESYLQEIRAENKRLQEDIRSSSPNENETQQLNLIDEDTEKHSFPNTNNVEDKFETSIQAQVLQLYNNGLSADKIAAKLERGQTEVDLVIKLYDKKKHKT